MTRLAIALLLVLLGLGPARALTPEESRHLLVRSGFAATPAAIEALLPLDRQAAAARVLAGARSVAVTPPPPWTRDWRPPRPPQMLTEAERIAFKKERRGWAQELKTWWVSEMIATPSPVTEVMTLFWHSHFTSQLRKVKSPVLMYRQNALLRRHALGNFGDLLREVARDPAMLLYLDGARNRKDAPNENFARELLELYTLGEGHYGEADIKEAARAFTGWSLERESGGLVFRQPWHDDGVKTVLGRSGHFDGDDVIEILLEHPRTAEHIVEKLWRHFVSPDPDPAEVARLSALFRDGGYELRPLMAALLASDAFYDPAVRGALIKSPVMLLVGTVRQFDLEGARPQMLAKLGRRLGQDLFDPPNVKGWPGGTAWITSTTLLDRQFLLAQVTGRGGARGMASDKNAMARQMPGGRFDRWALNLTGPWASAEAVQLLLLPLPPADAPVLDREPSGALVRRLLLDPVYQLN